MPTPPPAADPPGTDTFSLWRIALPAFGPSILLGLGEGAILPIVPLTARGLGASVPVAALMIALIGIGSLLCNIPASLLTLRFGERWAMSTLGGVMRIGMFAGPFLAAGAVHFFGLHAAYGSRPRWPRWSTACPTAWTC